MNHKLTDFHPFSVGGPSNDSAFSQESGSRKSDSSVNGSSMNGLYLCLSVAGSDDFPFVYLLMKYLQQQAANSAIYPQSSKASISDNQSDIIHGQPLLLLTTSRSRSHYEAVFRKNAIELGRLEAKGLVLVRQLVLPSELIPSDGRSDDKKDCLTWQDLQTWADNGLRYSDLCPHDLASTVTRFSIAIDDLEALDLSAPSGKEARRMLSRMMGHMQSSRSLPSSIQCIVAFGRECAPSHEYSMGTWIKISQDDSLKLSMGNGASLVSRSIGQDDEPQISEYLKYKANVLVSVSPLASGYSPDVHGVLTICRSGSMKRSNLIFKALDSGIRCDPISK